MESISVGLFEYIDPLSEDKIKKLPEFLRVTRATNEVLLFRFLLGHLDFKISNGQVKKRCENYFLLPFQHSPKLVYCEIEKSINDFFSTEANAFQLANFQEELHNYLDSNRKNSDIYEVVLFEISSYIDTYQTSPSAAFTHLYRCLEFLSYCFPLIYASKSRNYKGSFSDLRKFLSGDSSGELKFFGKFLCTCFEKEPAILNYIFEIDVVLSSSIDALKSDLKRISKSSFPYDFDNGVLRLKFEDMLSLFITIRNRYFHMLVGQGQENFESNKYNIEEFFKCINPHLLNWIAMIIQKITVLGFYSTLPGV